MKIKIVILFYIFSAVFIFNVFAQKEKLSTLMPRDTELISKKEDTSQRVLNIIAYKFASRSSKDKILDFYRRMFNNEGFSELKGYSPERQKPAQVLVYSFTKPGGELIMLNMLRAPENGLNVYYINVNSVKKESLEDPNIVK